MCASRLRQGRERAAAVWLAGPAASRAPRVLGGDGLTTQSQMSSACSLHRALMGSIWPVEP